MSKYLQGAQVKGMWWEIVGESIAERAVRPRRKTPVTGQTLTCLIRAPFSTRIVGCRRGIPWFCREPVTNARQAGGLPITQSTGKHGKADRTARSRTLGSRGLPRTDRSVVDRAALDACQRGATHALDEGPGHQPRAQRHQPGPLPRASPGRLPPLAGAAVLAGHLIAGTVGDPRAGQPGQGPGDPSPAGRQALELADAATSPSARAAARHYSAAMPRPCWARRQRTAAFG
jgi:hypothetical protein